MNKKTKGIVIADCGYTSGLEIVRLVLSQKKVPLPALFARVADKLVTMRTGVSLEDYSTLTAMISNETPVLFIHGTADTLVPLSMTITNYEVCKAPKQLYLCEGAEHAISIFVNEDLYFSAIEDFMQKYELIR